MSTPLSIKEAQAKDFVASLLPESSRARVEIEEFLGDNDLTNLYLLALEAMQKEDATKSTAKKNEDWWTFYSLSGIHGLPAERWNGIPNPSTGRGSYCTHGELVFPTWHRIYLNMFEQAVANKVQDIADQYITEPEKSAYQKAAKRFRIPFWDPYLPRNKVAKTARLNPKIWGYPKILATKEVWVKRPQGLKLEKIANPLYAFNFPSQTMADKGRVPVTWGGLNVPRQGRNYTIRHPSSNGESNIYGIDANDKSGLELALQSQARAGVTSVWKLLSPNSDNKNTNDLRSWSTFATHTVFDPKTGRDTGLTSDTAVSLESWHDNIHGLIGTGVGFSGHMGYPAVAGFDPIFWLHHCNVDRLLAIYQALYPDKWLEAQKASENMYPFRKNATEFWDSNDVRDWTTLGYAIPGNKVLDDKGRLALATYLHEYYNWGADGSFPPPSVTVNWPRDFATSVALNGENAKPLAQPVVSFEALAVSQRVIRSISVSTQQNLAVTVNDIPKTFTIGDEVTGDKVNPAETVGEGSVLTWNARIQVKKFAFDGSFNVHLFIGYIKEDQTERFLTKKNQVGFSTVFASSRDTSCTNCVKQRNDGLVYKDVIPITHALYAYLKSNTDPETDGPLMSLRTLESFAPEHVVPFLKKNAAWRLTDMASNLLDDQQQLIDSGLEVSISSRKFDLPTPEHPLGVYHPAQRYPEITSDKLGGFGFVVAASS